jgi:hypothetical protein
VANIVDCDICGYGRNTARYFERIEIVEGQIKK